MGNTQIISDAAKAAANKIVESQKQVQQEMLVRKHILLTDLQHVSPNVWLFQNKQLETQVKMQERMRRQMMAQAIATTRETFWWVLSGWSLLSTGAITLVVKGIFPLPLTLSRVPKYWSIAALEVQKPRT